MPEANSIPVLSNPVGRYPDHAPGATPEPKLLDCLREALRSRHFFAKSLLKANTWVHDLLTNKELGKRVASVADDFDRNMKAYITSKRMTKLDHTLADARRMFPPF